MSTIATTLPLSEARFQAVRLPGGGGGWTVADLLCGAAIVRSRPWDQTEADAVTDTLKMAPGYAVHFSWAALNAAAPGGRQSESAPGGDSPPRPPAAAIGDEGDLCAFCWQPAAPGAWVELRLYNGPGLKIGELTLKVCAGHLAALRPAYERGFVECRATRWETAADYPPGALGRRPEDRP